MPILTLIEEHADDRAVLRHPATARTTSRVVLAHLATAATLVSRVTLRHAATARSNADRVTLRHAVTSSAWPTAVRVGRPALEVTASVGATPATRIQYSHTGQTEEVTLDFHGDQRALAGQLFHVLVTLREGPHARTLRLGPFDADPEYTYDPREARTTLRATNLAFKPAQATVLPELIAWQLNPTPEPDPRAPCGSRPKPQRQNVHDLVLRAASEAGVRLRMRGAHLAGEEWIEGVTDYSTSGRTFLDVWNDTYGQIGYTLVLRGRELLGLPPGTADSFTHVRDAYLLNDVTTREALQEPQAVTVRGADLRTPTPGLLDLIAGAPDPQGLLNELGETSEWFTYGYSDDGWTGRGFRKSNGQVVDTLEVTVGDVTVQQTIDGEAVTRVFSRVAKGLSTTSTVYDAQCTDMILSQTTTQLSWGYDLNTITSSLTTPGPGLNIGITVGDLLSQERIRVEYRYSPEGHVTSRTTTTTRTVSLKQQNAESNPDERGPLQSHELATDTLTEVWQPAHNGKWWKQTTHARDEKLPVYDLDSLDPVRLGTRGASRPYPAELVDEAPPIARCPDRCRTPELVDPQEVRVQNTRGYASPVTLNLPFVRQGANLRALGELFFTTLARRVRHEVTTVDLLPAFPGVRTSLGVSTGLTLSVSAGNLEVRATLVELDALPTLTAERVTPDLTRGRSFVYWNEPGGVRARLFKGINPITGLPEEERIFIRTRTGFLPRSRSTVEWRLHPTSGQRIVTGIVD